MSIRSISLFFTSAVAALAGPVSIQLPLEKPGFKQGAGVELALQQCLICHSSEYITTQPPLSKAGWKASVEKMKAKFGAPIPAEQVDAIVEYLAAGYGQSNP
jgi:mono/diheme cytochrome c family protein